jgi:hypothetical protein
MVASVVTPAAPGTLNVVSRAARIAVQWTPGSWQIRRCWIRSFSIPKPHNLLRTCSKACRYCCSYSLVFTTDRTPQRIKGALDARIAEEQAKQRASAQASPSRSGSVPKRSNSRNLSPSKRPLKGKDGDSPGRAAPTGKGPDPSEFDPEFVIGEEDEQPNSSGTPRPKEKTEGGETAETAEDNGKEDAKAAEEKAQSALEMPPETKARLRKLDKLEPKYTGQCHCLRSVSPLISI